MHNYVPRVAYDDSANYRSFESAQLSKCVKCGNGPLGHARQSPISRRVVFIATLVALIAFSIGLHYFGWLYLIFG